MPKKKSRPWPICAIPKCLELATVEVKMVGDECYFGGDMCSEHFAELRQLLPATSITAALLYPVSEEDMTAAPI